MERHDNNFRKRKLYEDDVNDIDHGDFVAEGMEGGEENGAPVDEVVAPEVHVGHVREDKHFNDVVTEQDKHYPVDEVVAPKVHVGHVREDEYFNDVVTEQDKHYLQNINHDIPHLSPQNKSETEKNWSGENGQKQSSTSIIIKQSSTSIIIKQSSTSIIIKQSSSSIILTHYSFCSSQHIKGSTRSWLRGGRSKASSTFPPTSI